jgi:hypothetical protein
MKYAAVFFLILLFRLTLSGQAIFEVDANEKGAAFPPEPTWWN